jgi:hypothetical protein
VGANQVGAGGKATERKPPLTIRHGKGGRRAKCRHYRTGERLPGIVANETMQIALRGGRQRLGDGLEIGTQRQLGGRLSSAGAHHEPENAPAGD